MRATSSNPPLNFVLRALIALRHRPRLVLAMLLCLQVLHGTWGINQDIVWGHAGFHIGEYGTQAVHLRRHHAFIPAESDEFTKPRNSDLELRHPFLLHPYIAVMQAAFGERPWTARVVPLLFSLLALGGMWSFVRRTRDDLTAHLATAFFVLSPLNLIYCILPEYQISAVAWTLWAWVGTHETLRRPTGRSIALWLGCAALAGLTDWPWFEVAAFFFVLVAWRLRPGGPLARASTPRDVRTMRLALFGFCVVVLATFVQHFAIVKALGQAEALRHSFNDRTTVFNWAEARNMIKTRFPLLHTTPVLWATGLWVLRAVLGWRRDLATALFLAIFLGYTLDMKLFFSGHAFHEYRNSYWYVPVFAFAAADVTLVAARWLARRRGREEDLQPVRHVARRQLRRRDPVVVAEGVGERVQRRVAGRAGLRRDALVVIILRLARDREQPLLLGDVQPQVGAVHLRRRVARQRREHDVERQRPVAGHVARAAADLDVLRRQRGDLGVARRVRVALHEVVRRQDLARVVVPGLRVREERVVVIVVRERDPALVLARLQRPHRPDLGVGDLPELPVLPQPELRPQTGVHLLIQRRLPLRVAAEGREALHLIVGGRASAEVQVRLAVGVAQVVATDRELRVAAALAPCPRPRLAGRVAGQRARLDLRQVQRAVAVRIERLKYLSRSEPDLPASVEFLPIEIEAMKLEREMRAEGKRIKLPDMPTLAQATHWIAELGGWIGKRNGPPGSITLARGLDRLSIYVAAIHTVDFKRSRRSRTK